MSTRSERLAEARTWAGYRSARVSPQTGTLIVVVDGREADLDTDGGRWQTICDEHAHIVSHLTRADAEGHATDPLGWCEGCMEVADGSK